MTSFYRPKAMIQLLFNPFVFPSGMPINYKIESHWKSLQFMVWQKLKAQFYAKLSGKIEWWKDCSTLWT